jgi:hypothetical protein
MAQQFAHPPGIAPFIIKPRRQLNHLVASVQLVKVHDRRLLATAEIARDERMFVPRQKVLVFGLLAHLLDELDEVVARDLLVEDEIQNDVGDVVDGNTGTMTAV